ncbi:MAG: radical SAM family heme chaperone HemW [Abditibacteriota bacterium]|nr:radical SAM family heme chaperone HemW [Abditibacteriota bacterium]
METARAAYVHIPFCVSKCPYCDFNSYDNIPELKDDYVKALIREIRSADVSVLDTVYFGGGTPTSLPVRDLAAVLTRLPHTEVAEITLEANPGTVDFRGLSLLRRMGFNRLSLGVQSFDDATLARIGRIHTAAEARTAYITARRAGFDNIGLDLMFALPGEKFDTLKFSLGEIIRLGTEHVSVYELSVEEGTPFARSRVETPSDDYKADAYLYIADTLSAAGYVHYEVSNFARPGYESRHNSTYWRNEPYFGFGAGATEYLGGIRRRKISSVPEYIDAVNSGKDLGEFEERVTGREKDFETVSLMLRTRRGLRADDFPAFADSFRRLTEKGMLTRDKGRLRATRQGLLLLNDLLCEVGEK